MTKLFLVARPIFFLDYARTPTAKKANTVSKIKAPIALSPERRGKKERRHTADRRIENHTVAVERRKLQRREKVTRRRQIDPTTCERDYSDDEVEFMHALDQYKRQRTDVSDMQRSFGSDPQPRICENEFRRCDADRGER